MEIREILINIGAGTGTLILVWLLFKAVKLVWRLIILLMVLAVVSYFFPSVREWVAGFFP